MTVLAVFLAFCWMLGAGGMPKDVKNEGRSGDMYENKGDGDKMPNHNSGICARSNTRCMQMDEILSALADKSAHSK
jgi:hypothetical protein